MTSTTVQETSCTTTTITNTTKFRQIAPDQTEKPEYDVYHIPKGYEVLLVPKTDSENSDSNTDVNPIPLSPTGSISSASSTCSTSPKTIPPKQTLDNKNPSPSSWRKRKNNGHIPRPKNCFMAYREHVQHKILDDNPGMNNKDVSVIAANMWNNESDEVKQLWRERAQQLKIEHKIKYPDYKFAPKKKAQKNLSAVNSPLGVKTPKTIQKKFSSPTNALLRRNADNFNQLIDNENPFWTGHYRSSSVESVGSWTSNDSHPNTPPTFSSSLRYENDLNSLYNLSNDFSPILNVDATTVPSSAAGFYDPLLSSDYSNPMQIDGSDKSSYYLEEEEYDEDYLHQNNLLNTFVLSSQHHNNHSSTM